MTTRFRKQRNPVLISFLWLLSSWAITPCTIAQADPDTDYQAKRQRAADLFGQDKCPEALPVLEELVQLNADDDAMLIALAACLINHSATLMNQGAAARERFRAKALLDRAWNLGNTSPLAMNLSQLLRELPANGAIKFSDNPTVEQAMHTGEAAFAQHDFDQALKAYAHALELDPGNYFAALFTGNAWDRKNEFSKAAVWYQRAIQLDPNVETAYRYYADMLAKQGDMSKARAMLIHAAVAEPYNRIVWRELHAWASLNNTHINEVYVGVSAVPTNSPGAVQLSPDVSTVWQAYRSVRNSWQDGGEFKKHFPEEKEYRHTLAEESTALMAAAGVLQKLQEDKKSSELAANDAPWSLLLRLHHAGLIEPYVLFSLGDVGIARDYAAYRATKRNKLEEYMDQFVVPSVH
jgi:tetratricopeptide (TPR) repeat protein